MIDSLSHYSVLQWYNKDSNLKAEARTNGLEAQLGQGQDQGPDSQGL